MKSKLFLATIVIFELSVNAQIVNIPDANFKAELAIKDTNNIIFHKMGYSNEKLTTIIDEQI